MLPTHCLKGSLQHSKCKRDANGSSFTVANKYMFADLLFLQVERATKQRLPLVLLKSWGLMLPTRCWKPPLQHSKCKGDAN